MDSSILHHTRRLLRQGVFNHLGEQKITLLYLQLIRFSKTGSSEQIFEYWILGNFSESVKHQQLKEDTHRLMAEYCHVR